MFVLHALFDTYAIFQFHIFTVFYFLICIFLFRTLLLVDLNHSRVKTVLQAEQHQLKVLPNVRFAQLGNVWKKPAIHILLIWNVVFVLLGKVRRTNMKRFASIVRSANIKIRFSLQYASVAFLVDTLIRNNRLIVNCAKPVNLTKLLNRQRVKFVRMDGPMVIQDKVLVVG